VKTRKTKATAEQPAQPNTPIDPSAALTAPAADVLAQVITPQFAMYHGDSCEVLSKLPQHSVHYSIFSPPFASLYTYSNSPRDLGNVRNDEEFFAHFDHVIDGLKRVMMPGRLVSMHCMTMPTSKERDGYVGLRDFRGDLIRAFQAQGFVYHSEVCIWKDPVTAMQRTKALGLLHKTVRENASMSRQGLPDYLVTMRAPGECPREERVTHTEEEYPVSLWQRIASPVWDDINPSDTLQRESARDNDDERHICPLQLEVIRRGIELWTNPGDIVLSPFAGIGSEGHIAVGGATREGKRLAPRRFVGIELKDSYYAQAVKNLKAAATVRQLSLMDRMMGAE
jgi:DNA modification methylase